MVGGPARLGLPVECSELIAERSEGNPLYVEEIVRKLIDAACSARPRPRGGRSRDRSRTSSAAIDPGR